MANTNTPTTSTHQQIIIPPNGSGICALGRDQLRYYNNYPVVEKQLGQDPKYYVKPRPPAQVTNHQSVDTSTNSSILATYFDASRRRLYWTTPSSIQVADNDVEIAVPDDWTTASLSSIVQFRAGVTNKIAILETSYTGTFSRIHYTDVNALITIQTLQLPFFTNKIVFLDGYLFMSSIIQDRQRIYNTTLGNHLELLEGASFIDAEMDGDVLVTLSKHHNHIVAFGTNTIEFFYNSANEVGSPLSRQSSYAVNIGCYDPGTPGDSLGSTGYSVTEIEDNIYFIGQIDGNVQGLYKIENFRATKVTDYVGDQIIRSISNPRLCPYDLNGEICVLVLDQTGTMTPKVFIPSLSVFVEFQWQFAPAVSEIVGNFTRGNSSILFQKNTNSTPLWSSGTINWHTQIPQIEDIDSQFLVDYMDFNNNSRKHWKYVDVLGSFGSNEVALAYRMDSFGHGNVELINLPYVTASNIGAENVIRFRNLGQSRRMALVVFFRGETQYLYKGVCVGYNQWGN